MAETKPQLVSEQRDLAPEPMGMMTQGDGRKFPVFARLAFGPDKIISIDFGKNFVAALHDASPEIVQATADELSSMLRDAILRELAHGVN